MKKKEIEIKDIPKELRKKKIKKVLVV